jgi:hypothetical protein
MTAQKSDEMNDDARKRDRRAREEEVDRLLEEARALLRKNKVIFDRWRAEGILPPEDHRDCV